MISVIMQNRFRKAKTLRELEDAYINSLKTCEDMDLVEEEYMQRKNELSPSMEISILEESEVEKPKTQRKNKKITTNQNETFMTIYVRGNQPLPAFEPVLKAGKTYSAVDSIGYDLLYKAIEIKDYAPIIKDNTLYTNNVTKMSQIVEIEQDIEISLEDGEDVQLSSGFFTQNEATTRHIGENAVTVIVTYLLNPENNHIKYKLLTMWAYENGVLAQIEMKPIK